MKILKIKIKGANGAEAVMFLNALDEVQKRCPNSSSIDISYTWKEEEDFEPIPVTKYTPFSRYLQSTTPEGRTR